MNWSATYAFGAANVTIESDAAHLVHIIEQQLGEQFLTTHHASSGDLQISLLHAPSRHKRLISEPLLPLEPTEFELQRERHLKGWVMGDWLHVNDGLHLLDLNYGQGVARGFFTRAITTMPRLLSHTYVLVSLIELLRTREIYFMHGGCAVDANGRGTLFLGDGGVGKSTTIFALLRHGWRYLADDTLLMQRVDNSGLVEVVPLLQRFLLQPELMHRFPGLMLSELTPEGKGVLSPHSTEGKARVARARIDQVVVLKRVHDQSPTRLQPVSRASLLAELMHQNPFLFLQSHLASRHLEFLTALCHKVRPLKLTLGLDALENPGLVAKLLERYARLDQAEHYF